MLWERPQKLEQTETKRAEQRVGTGPTLDENKNLREKHEKEKWQIVFFFCELYFYESVAYTTEEV